MEMSPHELFQRTVGAIIRELRTARGLTQAQLADALTHWGMPTGATAVTRMEQGDRPLKLSEAFAVAEVLNVPVDYLTTGHDRAVRLVLITRETARAEEAGQALRDAGDALGGAQAQLRLLLWNLRESGEFLPEYLARRVLNSLEEMRKLGFGAEPADHDLRSWLERQLRERGQCHGEHQEA